MKGICRAVPNRRIISVHAELTLWVTLPGFLTLSFECLLTNILFLAVESYEKCRKTPKSSNKGHFARGFGYGRLFPLSVY